MLEKTLIVSFLASGTLLTLAAIAGMLVGVPSNAFVVPWILHVLLLLVATGTAIASVFSFAKQEMQHGSKVLIVFIFAAWVASCALGFLPLTARDALVHHLAVPEWWLAQGYMAPFDWHSWSFYPMLLQTGFLGLLQFGLIELCPLYHLCFGIILAAVSGYLTRRIGGDAYSLLGVSLCALLPVVMKLASIPLVDLGLAAYAAVSLLLFGSWLSTKKLSTLIAAGIALGLTASTKYNGLLFVCCFAPWISGVALLHFRSLRDCVVAAALVIVCASVIYAPWSVQNYLLKGNPIYPLAQGVLGPSEINITDERDANSLSPLSTRRFLHNESWAEILLVPMRVFFQGEDENPKLFDGRLSPLLLFAIIPLFRRQRVPALIICLGTTVLYFALSLLLTDVRVRYMAPIYGPAAALAAFGIHTVFKSLRRNRQQYALYCLIFIQVSWALYYLRDVALQLHVREYVSGALTKDEYLARLVPEYQIAKYMNEHLPPTSRTYMVLTSNRFFYFKRPIVARGHASANELLSWVRQSPDATTLVRTIQGQGYTHVLLHMPRLHKLTEVSLTLSERTVLGEFLSHHTTRLAYDRGAVLLSIN